METTKNEIHSEIGDQDAQEGQYGEDMEIPSTAEPFQRFLMKTE